MKEYEVAWNIIIQDIKSLIRYVVLLVSWIVIITGPVYYFRDTNNEWIQLVVLLWIIADIIITAFCIVVQRDESEPRLRFEQAVFLTFKAIVMFFLRPIWNRYIRKTYEAKVIDEI